MSDTDEIIYIQVCWDVHVNEKTNTCIGGAALCELVHTAFVGAHAIVSHVVGSETRLIHASNISRFSMVLAIRTKKSELADKSGLCFSASTPAR